MSSILDGRAFAAELRSWVAERARELAMRTGVRPRLEVLLVGDHPASRAYVRTKARMAQEAGIAGGVRELPASIDTAGLLAEIARLGADPSVHGILVQLPLPSAIDVAAVLAAIPPEKDVDGFHPLNVGRLWSAPRPLESGLLLPCTPLGCMLLLEAVCGKDGLAGKRALVVGRSNIVGKPMAALLLARDCTVTIAHSKSRDLPALCREAEILVAAVGRPRTIRGDWIREGAVVLDVGINRVPTPEGSRLVGDVAFEEATRRAAAITPVPGGVGPMTVACLLANTLVAASRAVGATPPALPRLRRHLVAAG
ncbi:Bifunctional protein FolD protein [bacterium HR40]|nr:Bifunctional protein FolD protein [bacterium HR40]